MQKAKRNHVLTTVRPVHDTEELCKVLRGIQDKGAIQSDRFDNGTVRQQVRLWQKHKQHQNQHCLKCTTGLLARIFTYWNQFIGEQTIADAILDRLVYSAHRINLKGESMRKKLKKNH